MRRTIDQHWLTQLLSLPDDSSPTELAHREYARYTLASQLASGAEAIAREYRVAPRTVFRWLASLRVGDAKRHFSAKALGPKVSAVGSSKKDARPLSRSVDLRVDGAPDGDDFCHQAPDD